mmetsp:Transcript_3778/g.11368  ORF Transcript_3778/g.11368 Transcript_3778/m.11368 type:complete len:366 (+) Transcript_3778:548-1645(+)
MTSLPDDVETIIFGMVGFNALPNCSMVSKNWHANPALATARVRHRRSVDAMPAVPTPRDLSDDRFAREYLSLAPQRPPPDGDCGPRTIVCCGYGEEGRDRLAAVFSPQNTRCVLRTVTNQAGEYPFIVEINKYTGEVLVYAHPRGPFDEDDYPIFDVRMDFAEYFHGLVNGEPHEIMTPVDLDAMPVLERFQPVGVFIGICSKEYRDGDDIHEPDHVFYGDSILLQLAVSDQFDPAAPEYRYVSLGGAVRWFTTPEPITRYFAYVTPNSHINFECWLSASNVYFHLPANVQLQGQPFPEIIYYPRHAFKESNEDEARGEGIWELCSRFDVLPHASELHTRQVTVDKYPYGEGDIHDLLRQFFVPG